MMDAINIVDFILSIVGLVLAIVAILYSRSIARRSDHLVTRQVVEPLRPLDTAWGGLASDERAIVSALFQRGPCMKRVLTEQDLHAVQVQHPEHFAPRLDFLVKTDWLRCDTLDSVQIKPDRVPFLTFTIGCRD